MLPSTHGCFHKVEVRSLFCSDPHLLVRNRPYCSHMQLQFITSFTSLITVDNRPTSTPVIIVMPHYLDPEQIFPKRLGLMHGNTLVLEYYDLSRDRFKKHLIEFQPGTEPKIVVEEIFKNARHVPFLRKVNPKNVKAILQGRDISPKPTRSPITPYPAVEPVPTVQPFVRQENPAPFAAGPEALSDDWRSREKRSDRDIDSGHIEEVREKKEVQEQKEPPVQKQAEGDEYYEEEFQEFQVSHSLDKPQISMSKVEPLPSNSENQALEKERVEEKGKGRGEVREKEDIGFEFIEEPRKDVKKKKKEGRKGKSKGKGKKGKESVSVEEQFEFL